MMRQIAAAILATVFLGAVFAGLLVPAPFAKQFRESPSAPPSAQHPLGTDELGRDALSRLLYGTRVSLLLAPAAALVATFLAALVGCVAGFVGGWVERAALGATNLSLSLPWLFLLLTVRAVLPLNVAPGASVAITFALLGLLGWPDSARVICASTRVLRDSGFVLEARACGCSTPRLLWKHLLPNLKPVLFAQFWVSVPVFILTEANLGILGLGVSEPLPSWGNLLRGLEDFHAVASNPWRLAPLGLLIVVVCCFELILPREEFA